MNSQCTDEFWELYRGLPREVRRTARRAYEHWRENPHHPGLQFKKITDDPAYFSVRVGIHYRAIGLLEDSTITWFFIGTHAEYDHLIDSL
jgi:hypothetical protein